jgi:hypothetical protein
MSERCTLQEMADQLEAAVAAMQMEIGDDSSDYEPGGEA